MKKMLFFSSICRVFKLQRQTLGAPMELQRVASVNVHKPRQKVTFHLPSFIQILQSFVVCHLSVKMITLVSIQTTQKEMFACL